MKKIYGKKMLVLTLLVAIMFSTSLQASAQDPALTVLSTVKHNATSVTETLGQFTLYFNNEMAEDTLTEKNIKFYQVTESGDNELQLNKITVIKPYGDGPVSSRTKVVLSLPQLEKNTKYKVSLSENVVDKFGQTAPTSEFIFTTQGEDAMYDQKNNLPLWKDFQTGSYSNKFGLDRWINKSSGATYIAEKEGTNQSLKIITGNGNYSYLSSYSFTRLETPVAGSIKIKTKNIQNTNDNSANVMVGFNPKEEPAGNKGLRILEIRNKGVAIFPELLEKVDNYDMGQALDITQWHQFDWYIDKNTNAVAFFVDGVPLKKNDEVMFALDVDQSDMQDGKGDIYFLAQRNTSEGQVEVYFDDFKLYAARDLVITPSIENGAVNVDKATDKFTVTFNNDMTFGYFNNENIKLYKVSSNGDVLIPLDNSAITYDKPTGSSADAVNGVTKLNIDLPVLGAGRTYKIVLSNNITDLFGQSAESTFTFTCDGEPTNTIMASNAVLTDLEGNPINPDELFNATLSCDITNGTEEAIVLQKAIAVYDNQKLIDVAYETEVVNSDETKSITLTLPSITSELSNPSIKAMIWDKNCAPLVIFD